MDGVDILSMKTYQADEEELHDMEMLMGDSHCDGGAIEADYCCSGVDDRDQQIQGGTTMVTVQDTHHLGEDDLYFDFSEEDDSNSDFT
jgi:hypothetical protein